MVDFGLSPEEMKAIDAAALEKTRKEMHQELADKNRVPEMAEQAGQANVEEADKNQQASREAGEILAKARAAKGLPQ